MEEGENVIFFPGFQKNVCGNKTVFKGILICVRSRDKNEGIV